MTDVARALALRVGLGVGEVKRIMSSAPNRYKVFYIPKKDGSLRLIAQPSLEVKNLQRALVGLLLEQLPIHKAATAYRSGYSLLDNARPHAGLGSLVKLDLKEFFPSIRQYDWHKYCQDSGCLKSDEDIELTSRLLFRNSNGSRVLRLAIGAPSSPILSNILMYNFDQFISDHVGRDKVVYTRYADDLTFSAPRMGNLSGVVSVVAQAIRKIKYPKLEIKIEKTVKSTHKYSRRVTGLVLANDGRVTLGRAKKREISAGVHGALVGRLAPESLAYLAGLLAYVHSVEPPFLDCLSEKYGSAVISKIRSHQRREGDALSLRFAKPLGALP